jgi:hypothetical protein
MLNSVRYFIPAKRLVPLVFVADAAVRAECNAQHPVGRWHRWWPKRRTRAFECSTSDLGLHKRYRPLDGRGYSQIGGV